MEHIQASAGSLVSVRATTWREQAALAMETADVRVVMVPGMGAKIVSLLDRRADFEWLAGPIAGRQVKPVAYGATFTGQDMAGWDEMFPTIVACPYPGPGPQQGTALPDHGEAWSLPWAASGRQATEVALTLTGRALPYRLSRRATFAAADTLRLHYTLENLGGQPMPYLWAAHPQFLARPGCEIVLPPEVAEVVNTIPAEWGWGPPESRFSWPEAEMDGRRIRLDRVGPASLARARKFFAVADAHPSWVAILDRQSGNRLRFEWDPAEVPYLGLWVDEGAIHQQAIVAPEPGTGWYDSLALAWQNGQVTVAPAHGQRQWTLTVRLGGGSASRGLLAPEGSDR